MFLKKKKLANNDIKNAEENEEKLELITWLLSVKISHKILPTAAYRKELQKTELVEGGRKNRGGERKKKR